MHQQYGKLSTALIIQKKSFFDENEKHIIKQREISKVYIRQSERKLCKNCGKEFAGHEEIASKLKADFYFAHPYSSWERGTNENTNGLIRQYFPKNRDFTTITQQEINMAMERLNNRPRKRLGYQTPNQVFFESGVALHI